MVAFDSTIILALLEPEHCIPKHPITGDNVENAADRIDFLIETLQKDGEKIVIPTPALSEILVLAGDAGPEYLRHLESVAPFRVVDFDKRAAVQVAAMTSDAIFEGDKRDGSEETWAKVKYDRQIVAIAKVEGCSVIYSDDEGVRRVSEKNGMTVIKVADLPLPEKDPQQPLLLDSENRDL
ncbi:MAG: PIN domain-containing protein [Xanthomonadales bacterium]|nr:PIN domain-containing protein [Xanthomonadales bacterium]